MGVLPIVAYGEIGVLHIVAQEKGILPKATQENRCFTHSSTGKWVFY